MLTKKSIGFIGCSNSTHSVEGYHSTRGNKGRLWPANEEYGGETVDCWADASAPIWNTFAQSLKTYGQPLIVWVQLCELEKRPCEFAQVQAMLANLRQRCPSAQFYVSALNSYSPKTLCEFMGPDGTDDLVAFRDQAVAAGLALRGPDLGPLTARLTMRDKCHPNAVGKRVLGRQLAAFFDAL